MSTHEDKLNKQIDQNNIENQEEEEQIDEETSKALKNLKIDDSAFAKHDKDKKADKKSKQNKVIDNLIRNQNKRVKIS
jgi:hypothetical protein